MRLRGRVVLLFDDDEIPRRLIITPLVGGEVVRAAPRDLLKIDDRTVRVEAGGVVILVSVRHP
jgi:hypothetical protein